MSTNPLLDAVNRLKAEVPHFISTDVVDIDSGLSIAGGSIDPNFDASVASACYAEVVKSNARALDLIGIGANATEDILITTHNAYLLLRMIGQRHYLGLALGRQGTLGFARALMVKYAPYVLKALPT
jgi:predicted regulator of Ras-like GTPase activity (Roadblock/LC7/MglB family)